MFQDALLRNRYKLINHPSADHWELFKELTNKMIRNPIARSMKSKYTHVFNHKKNREAADILRNMFNTCYWAVDTKPDLNTGSKNTRFVKLTFLEILKPKVAQALSVKSKFSNPFRFASHLLPSKHSIDNKTINMLFSLLKKHSFNYKVIIYEETKIISVETEYRYGDFVTKYGEHEKVMHTMIKTLEVSKQQCEVLKRLRNCIVVFNYNLIRSLILQEKQAKVNITELLCLPIYEDLRMGFLKTLIYLEKDKLIIRKILNSFNNTNPVAFIKTMFRIGNLEMLRQSKELFSLEDNPFLQRFYLLETIKSLSVLLGKKQEIINGENVCAHRGINFDLIQEMIKGTMKFKFTSTIKEENMKEEILVIYKEISGYKMEDQTEDFKILLNQFCSFLRTLSKNTN